MSAVLNLNDFGNPIAPDPALKTDAGSRGGQTPKPGILFPVQFPTFAAADVAKVFFVVPAACELLYVYESHATKAGQAGTMQIEKLTSTETAGNGDVLLTAAFDLASDNSTPVRKEAIPTAQLEAGDRLCLKVASGAATSLAGASLTAMLRWL